MEQRPEMSVSCPVALRRYANIVLAHGGGGTLMHELLQETFLSAFHNPVLDQRHDSALLDIAGVKLAFTTDSYVVHPLVFPGGDIGSLAVHGTINDLAMLGARPRYLSAGFILEEGLPVDTLNAVVVSMQHAAERCGVQIATGDTKVVERGKGDGVFINTTGIGQIEHSLEIGPRQVKAGDAILINGDIGRHGIAIIAVRQGLEFETTIESDSAPVAGLVRSLIEAGIEIHCLRDLTRGGLASAANEIAEAARLEIRIDETAVPVREDVRGACEMLGFDPLYVANEGRFIAFTPARDVSRALDILHSDPLGAGASQIGEVATNETPLVTLKSRIGAARILDMLSGEQLPRIC
ncbi:MAG: hydrogenase expression/formation protein HypE [Candidatus Hydrogenedentes bacterium]|nr:hydrogenase expression/formation protein HypE [Candidatus Hydrogenedentota bacterium]